MDLSNKIAVGGIAFLMWKNKKKAMNMMINLCQEIAKINRNTKVHLFGTIHEYLLMTYPFFSCDSTSWLKTPAYGRTVKFTGKGFGYEYGIKEKQEPTIHNIKSIDRRQVESIQAVYKYQDFITELWKKRGIVWEN